MLQKKILITGTAGFIGYHLTGLLAKQGHSVVCLDSINDYYDVELKYARLNNLGFNKTLIQEKVLLQSTVYPNLQFAKLNIAVAEDLKNIFAVNDFDVVCHLAAQAGVRYSIENPASYIDSNIVGFFNMLENCRHSQIKKLVYASSSSVYGNNAKVPFSTDDTTDQPISLYAATKKSNELMAYTYSHLFNIKTVGLRFFTAYGPWGRPDMAYFSFTQAILQHKTIKVFAEGKLKRDFTYIDDIVDGICRVIFTNEEPGASVYNIGNNNPVTVNEFINTLESILDKKAIKDFLPMQPGDVNITYADISQIQKDYGYSPRTMLKEGLAEFAKWFVEYYQKP